MVGVVVCLGCSMFGVCSYLLVISILVNSVDFDISLFNCWLLGCGLWFV